MNDKPLLDEDHEPIREVPEKQRKAWEPKREPYAREDYERDRAAREKRDDSAR